MFSCCMFADRMSVVGVDLAQGLTRRNYGPDSDSTVGIIAKEEDAELNLRPSTRMGSGSWW